jgi:hypothetical protein
MKPSERLKAESAREENDLRAMGLYKKACREERLETFKDNHLPALKEKYGDKVYYDQRKQCYTMPYKDKFVDFYPKANKLFINKQWKTHGLKWIKENLI